MHGLTHLFVCRSVGNLPMDQKLGIVAGTYIGTGIPAATMLTITGVNKIHHVWMDQSKAGFSTATTRARILPSPEKAGGTLNGFYPFCLKLTGTGNVTNNAVAATFIWRALVE